MSGETLLAVQAGRSLGEIGFYDTLSGKRIRGVGELKEGIIPEKSVLASSNTHAYVAAKRARGKTEEVVIALRHGEPLATIEVGARLSEAGQSVDTSIEPDPELLKGALKIAMRDEHYVAGVLSQDAQVSDETAIRAGFHQDDGSGSFVFKPGVWPVTAPPPETLQEVW